MATTAPPHLGCSVFRELDVALDRTGLHRFVLGEDAEPRALTPAGAAAELADPFATLLLLRGTFPVTAGELAAALDAATADDDPLRRQTVFLLGEGSQLPMRPETAGVERNLRFIVARGGGPDGPDLVVSAFHPDDGAVEVMAWDRVAGGFNFYRTVGDARAWVFAGNSRHALDGPTRGLGPFESHTSGSLLMKELRAPWVNWDSPSARIQPSVFAAGDVRAAHPWFTGREPFGAVVCEREVARPAVMRWARTRFDRLRAAGVVEHPQRIMEQILDTPTVNLVTSHTESANAAAVGTVDLPQTFFVDSEALTEQLGLPAPPRLVVDAPLYLQSLGTFGVCTTDDRGFRRDGDTHFAFLVPERAFEDLEALRRARRVGLVTDRLAACLLMTDFPNPILSARRAALLAHVPPRATLDGGASAFSDAYAQAILAAAGATPDGSPEREFAARWAAEDAWRDAFGALLRDFYAAVAARLRTQDGFDDVMRLAESRRARIRGLRIVESPLLFCRTNLPRSALELRPDGTIAEVDP